MTRIYYRPIPCRDAARPEGALPLAGGALWFDKVEALSRTAPPSILPASALPDAERAVLTEPRARIAGLDWAAPRLMGILNVTPDSFSDGGLFEGEGALLQAETLLREGADIIDIGGESTRPGATLVPEEEELRRIEPVVEALHAEHPRLAISIDTRKANVAAAALQYGAALINDVSALTFDPAMAPLLGGKGAPVCLTHAQGDPETMQDDPHYENVLLDVYDGLEARIAAAEKAGVPRSAILIDPGIGFGKTEAHNLALLSRLSLMHGLGCPILVGVSRKGFIGHIGRVADKRARAPGSIAVGLHALAQGVHMLRVHDIAETKQAIRLWQAVV